MPGIRPRFAIARPSISLISPVKSIGLAPLDVLVALHVEAGTDLVDEVGRDPAALGGRIEPDAVQPVAERVRDSQRLLGLVLERVDEHDPGDVLAQVAVERERRLDGVPEDQDQRVRHRAGRGQTSQPCAGRGRGADAPTDDRRVVEDVGDVRMDVAGPEADHGLGRRDVDDLAGCRRPAGRLGEHPQKGRLIQPEPAVPGPDPQDDLARADPGAVGQRFDRGLPGIAVREDVADQVLGLVDAAQDGLSTREHLHRDDGVEALGGEDALRPREVDVG